MPVESVKVIEGLSNYGVLKKFNVTFMDENGSFRSNECQKHTLIAGSVSVDKGYFRPWESESYTTFQIQYVDTIDRVVIIVCRDLTCPKVRVYSAAGFGATISSFLIEGHFRFIKLVVESKNFEIDASRVNEGILKGTPFEIYQKIHLVKVGEPAITLTTVKSKFGDTQIHRPKTNMEI